MFRDVEISPVKPAAPFASAADIKAYVGVSGSGEDTLFTALAEIATLQIEAYCGTIIAQRTVTERVRLDGAQRSIVLQYAPAIALTSLSYDGEAQTAGDYQLAKAMATLRHAEGAEFGAEADWVAVYTAGFASVPDAVAHACKELAKSLYNAKSRDGSIQRESVPDVGDVQYFAPDTSLVVGPSGATVPSSVAVLLEPYVMRFGV